MQLQEAVSEIKKSIDQMNASYGRVLFDEWALVSFARGAMRLVHYFGPRLAGFQQNFATDLVGLRGSLSTRSYTVGDFEFARHAVGTGFESFMVVGAGLYLICNNTAATMDMIAKEPSWLAAQVPFAGLGDNFRDNPLVM